MKRGDGKPYAHFLGELRAVGINVTEKLSPTEWNNLPPQVKNQVTEMCKRYRQDRDRRRQVAQANAYSYDKNCSNYSSVVPPSPPVPPFILPPPLLRQLHVILPLEWYLKSGKHNLETIYNHVTVLSLRRRHLFLLHICLLWGERNEQAQQRSENARPRSISNVISKRTISEADTKMPEPAPNTTAVNTKLILMLILVVLVRISSSKHKSTDLLMYIHIPMIHTSLWKMFLLLPVLHPTIITMDIILVVNEALYHGTKMDHSLDLYMQADDDVNIPLHYQGTSRDLMSV